MWRGAGFAALLALQIACAGFFAYDIFAALGDWRSEPLAWHVHELIEIGAAVGLFLGIVTGAMVLRTVLRHKRTAEERLRRASVAFIDLLEEFFDRWGLTPAERDVALFAIKGMSTAEIAALRSTSEGTVKAQTASIYRKAEVNSRAELLALIIDATIEVPGPGETGPPGRVA
ncbi:MAG: helix-turn-helix transcriptional regulator [Pseudooceanicola sp.]